MSAATTHTHTHAHAHARTRIHAHMGHQERTACRRRTRHGPPRARAQIGLRKAWCSLKLAGRKGCKKLKRRLQNKLSNESTPCERVCNPSRVNTVLLSRWKEHSTDMTHADMQADRHARTRDPFLLANCLCWWKRWREAKNHAMQKTCGVFNKNGAGDLNALSGTDFGSQNQVVLSQHHNSPQPGLAARGACFRNYTLAQRTQPAVKRE